ncbi:MAG: hypothetical protein B7Y01_05145, partial [Xanthobacter sp. 17-67-6]
GGLKALEAKALSVGSGADGGYLVPAETEHEIARRLTQLSPIRALASVRTILNGAERQNYPLADMIFPPHRLVALLSQDMTLNPGDLIACGTSVGVGSMKDPSNEIDIVIDGIGVLKNIFVQ